jgi:hypothetical protein
MAVRAALQREAAGALRDWILIHHAAAQGGQFAAAAHHVQAVQERGRVQGGAISLPSARMRLSPNS